MAHQAGALQPRLDTEGEGAVVAHTTVRLSDDALRGLAFLAAVNHSDVSKEIQAAVEDRLQRYGLRLVGGQVVPVRASWEAQRGEGAATGPDAV